MSNSPKALHSLITLSIYKIGTHFNQVNDQQTLAIRNNSRGCLLHIHQYGDASDQSKLVNVNYSGVLVIAISTASGHGEEEDGNSFPPQPLLAHRSDEQIEEEGGNEEIDSQLINEGFSGNIKNSANWAKGAILNYFIEQGNTRPDWYNW
ncbi:MAG: hypothetical protein EZS28_017569 [Streblomastix strix]|uniref:Uncharacterized protein n=1 Tax=Streblomastix strix TaxID=222440 RepID=A0A5J4VXK2_9EUKA|nr:MAG: hypothetical protein EZS28_017569 [Streblomastix strix]